MAKIFVPPANLYPAASRGIGRSSADALTKIFRLARGRQMRGAAASIPAKK